MTDQVLQALSLKLEDKLIAMREDHLADGSFILASIMSYCLSNDRNICLVSLHNTIGHYYNIGKRLGFDLLNEIKEGHVKTVEPLKDLAEDILSEKPRYLLKNKEEIVKHLFLQIKEVAEDLLKNSRQTTIIIDDLSHLIDLTKDYHYVITFIKYCRGLTFNNNISLVVNCHVNVYAGIALTTDIFHSADLSIIVSPLKTGRSRNVSGRFSVNRKKLVYSYIMQDFYHYKLCDKEIRVFAPGMALI